MAINYYDIDTTAVTLMTTELNTAATGSLKISSVGGSSGVFRNLNGGGTSDLDGRLSGRFELLLASGHNISVNGAINVFLLTSNDGTNFERGSASVMPNRPPDFTFYPGIESGAQYLTADARLPPGYFKVLVQLINLGSGAQLASSGNTLKVIAFTGQSV